MLPNGYDPPQKSPGTPPEVIGEAGYVAYVFFCLFGMSLFVHGLSTFCAGLTSPKSSLSQLAYSVVIMCLDMILFYAFGYTIEASAPESSANWTKFVGNFSKSFFRNVDFENVYELGDLLLLYGFSVVPACLLASAACQRGRFIPLLVFTAATMAIVSFPVAYWCWNENGWIYKIGALDYAGGTIIHITAGFGALVYSLVLGPRISYGASKSEDQPYSLPMVVSGTAQMMLGWIGFTGGSQIASPAQAITSVLNTLLSAALGGFSWMILDHVVVRHYGLDRNPMTMAPPYSIISFCSGVISGLVAITPAAGYVRPGAAIFIGVCGGIGCNLSTKLKFYLGVDDPLDTFAVHGMGGVIGTLLTGIFAVEKYRVPWQFWVQALSVVTVAMYTLGCALLIVVTIDSVPFLPMRLNPEQESLGTDYAEHRETAAVGAVQTGHNWYVTAAGGGNTLDMTQLRQTNVNSPMHPGSFGQPLLQKLPLSYGTYTRRETPQADGHEA